MDRTAIEYLNYLENSDPFFFNNFNDFIVYASALNKNLGDEDYSLLKEGKDSNYIVSLKDKRTTINIIKNFFYKISPNIIKQIDIDNSLGNIHFVSRDSINSDSKISLDGNNYIIEIADSSKIDESYYLVREYAHLFVSSLLDAEAGDRGLKKVYIEMIISLTEFALAKHLSTNNALVKDSNNYIFKKLFDSIFKMNDSYLTLMYLGYLLENKSHDEIVRIIGSEEKVEELDNNIRSKKPCNDYIITLGTMLALKLANNTDNLFDLVNMCYIKAASKDLNYFTTNMPIVLDDNETVRELSSYIEKNK